jgi:hypothetical protein
MSGCGDGATKSPVRNPGTPGNSWKIPVLGLALVVSVFAAYYPARHFPFIDIDDSFYVYNNSAVKGPLNWSTLEQAFIHSYCGTTLP